MSGATPNAPRVYIHEFVDIIGHNRANYLQHMTANWGPIGRAERNQLCFGVWATVGSTGRWPQVVNLWEYENWASLGRNFEIEQRGSGLQDPSLEAWWSVAAGFRSGGVDRILVAADWSPSIEEHCVARAEGAPPAAGYAHELVRCRPGGAGAVLDAVRDLGIEAYEGAGLCLVGAFRRAMVDEDECVLIWSFDTWDTWARFEAGVEADGPGPMGNWTRVRRVLVTGFERILMADAPLSPLRTGRQPLESDRVGLP